MGVPINAEEETNNSPQTNVSAMTDSDSDLSEFPRKKKMFSSSSFYEEPNAIYPTVEEQVEMCRKIADSLSDDCNKRSKGANMFFKRVKRAEKWVVDSAILYESEKQTENISTSDLAMMPYVRVGKDPPRLKLILDPRHIVDMKQLKREGINIVEHNAVSPEICHDLVKDLNSPTGKGAQLFAKRKKKSEEWIVDEEKVRALLEKRQDRESSPEHLIHPRVKLIKTPWSAAMESPIGCCDAAFKEVLGSNDLIDSVIKAAEAKVMTYPSPRMSVLERSITHCEQFTPLPAASQLDGRPSSFLQHSSRTDVYLSRPPKGWTGPSFTSSSFGRSEEAVNSVNCQTTEFSPQLCPTPKSSNTLLQNFSPVRTLSFNDFNNRPKAWSPGEYLQIQQKQVKPVRLPSLLAQ